MEAAAFVLGSCSFLASFGGEVRKLGQGCAAEIALISPAQHLAIHQRVSMRIVLAWWWCYRPPPELPRRLPPPVVVCRGVPRLCDLLLRSGNPPGVVHPLAVVALAAATQDPGVLAYMTLERQGMPEDVVRLWYRMGSHKDARTSVEDLMVGSCAKHELFFHHHDTRGVPLATPALTSRRIRRRRCV